MRLAVLWHRRNLPLLAAALTIFIGCSDSAKPIPTATSPQKPLAQVFVATATVSPTSQPTPTSHAQVLLVSNTGGEGVFIRRTPALADRLKAWPDGTPMLVVGEDSQGEGPTWKNVKDPAGNVGWIPTEYLYARATTAVPSAIPVAQSSCIEPSASFVQEIVKSLTVYGRGGLANVRGIRVRMSDTDQLQWYLVGAVITGPGMGNSEIGLWLTSVDMTGDNIAGVVYSANVAAKEFSQWPQPKVIEGKYTSSDPDARKVKACVTGG